MAMDAQHREDWDARAQDICVVALRDGVAWDSLETNMWQSGLYISFRKLRSAYSKSKNDPKLEKQMKELLRFGMGKYSNMAQALLKHGGVRATDSQARSLFQRCLQRMGDLLRYQASLRSKSGNFWEKVEDAYVAAWTVNPKNGHAHNQLAVVHNSQGNLLEESFHFFCACMAERQFPAAVGNLTSTFNRIRTAFIAAADDPTTKVIQSFGPSTLARGSLATGESFLRWLFVRCLRVVASIHGGLLWRGTKHLATACVRDVRRCFKGGLVVKQLAEFSVDYDSTSEDEEGGQGFVNPLLLVGALCTIPVPTSQNSPWEKVWRPKFLKLFIMLTCSMQRALCLVHGESPLRFARWSDTLPLLLSSKFKVKDTHALEAARLGIWVIGESVGALAHALAHRMATNTVPGPLPSTSTLTSSPISGAPLRFVSAMMDGNEKGHREGEHQPQLKADHVALLVHAEAFQLGTLWPLVQWLQVNWLILKRCLVEAKEETSPEAQGPTAKRRKVEPSTLPRSKTVPMPGSSENPQPASGAASSNRKPPKLSRNTRKRREGRVFRLQQNVPGAAPGRHLKRTTSAPPTVHQAADLEDAPPPPEAPSDGRLYKGLRVAVSGLCSVWNTITRRIARCREYVEDDGPQRVADPCWSVWKPRLLDAVDELSLPLGSSECESDLGRLHLTLWEEGLLQGLNGWDVDLSRDLSPPSCVKQEGAQTTCPCCLICRQLLGNMMRWAKLRLTVEGFAEEGVIRGSSMGSLVRPEWSKTCPIPHGRKPPSAKPPPAPATAAAADDNTGNNKEPVKAAEQPAPSPNHSTQGCGNPVEPHDTEAEGPQKVKQSPRSLESEQKTPTREGPVVDYFSSLSSSRESGTSHTPRSQPLRGTSQTSTQASTSEDPEFEVPRNKLSFELSQDGEQEPSHLPGGEGTATPKTSSQGFTCARLIPWARDSSGTLRAPQLIPH